ncbi:restriction endonuclease subunit S [Propionivibrio limicola]|uniref:restriction endonuclease subunit S n=1 Tax=Propionivibrio limicola TaxID=167645 RepID=UPI00129154D6|nr:restriction endonuclease subunit S [Propionivibrio limicola]
MSSEWVTSSLLDHYEVRSGLSKPAKDFGSGYPFLTFKDVFYNYFTPDSLGDFVQSTEKEREGCSISRGDVFLTRTSETMHELGMSCVALRDYKDATFNGFCKRLRPKPDSDLLPEYVGYYLRSPNFRQAMLALSTMSTRASLNNEMIGRLEISFPPRKTQTRISEILKSLDDRIALLRETNATLEAIAQALFKSWFVDFDPVHAKARGETPEGMDDATAALFPDGFEESELGAVPRGWRLVPFGELLSHTIGGDWGDETPNDKNNTQVAIIRGTDMPDLQSGMSGRVPVRYTSQKKLASRKLQDGDLVLEVSGGSKDQPTGRSLYMTDGLLGQFDCPVEPASFCRLLRPASQELGVLLSQHMTYIYADGKTWQYQNQSTGIANFQTTHFLGTELVTVPTDDVLKVFAETVRLMIDRSHLTQIAQLTTLRDTLLPRLISGQLRLPETEAAIEGAL